MKIFGIIGKPVAHSLSPVIHNRWFKELNLDCSYLKIHSLNCKHAIEFSKKLNVYGLNITSPYKEELLKFTIPDKASVQIGAINTICLKENKIQSFNTDFIGVSEGLKKSFCVDDKTKLTAVILGSGGAAKAATYALVTQLGISSTIIARNKSEKDKLEQLGAAFCEFSSDKAKADFNKADIIITTLPANVELPTGFTFKQSAILFDAIYNTNSKVYIKAKSFNVKTIDGLDWLFEQAKPAFKIFTGYDAPNDEINFLKNTKIKTKPVILIGMMGSGKSSVAKHLASKNLSVIDLDKAIEKQNSSTISEIFKKFGESYFRDLELKALKEALNDNYDVISCGGGIVTSNQAIDILKNEFTVWLWASPKELTSRLSNQTIDRPLLSSLSLKTAELSDKISHLYENRFNMYAACSSIIFDTESLTTEQLATEILNEANIVK